MANPITTLNGTHDLAPRSGSGKDTAVTVQGDANDFVWSIQQSHNGTDWVAIADGDGSTTFTGANPKTLNAVTGWSYRVIVTDLGTATEVYVGQD